MRSARRQAHRSALILAGFALLITLLLAVTWLLTHERIARSEADTRRALLGTVLPAGSFDNDPAQDCQNMPVAVAQQLAGKPEACIYRARQHGQLAGYIVEAAAPNGYAGRIDLLVGLTADGRVYGVRVLQHRETPGLGDYIDLSVSQWATQFSGQPAARLASAAVRKDGGQIDYVSGATISARAVTDAVARVARYIHQQRLPSGALP